METKVLKKEKPKEKVVNLNEIVLFNDDVNSFDWVIECLVEICEHDVYQAEQCAWITHYKGKCAVKTGEFSELEPMCTALLGRGLSAEIK